MKKILEVLLDGDNVVRFNTDVKNLEKEFPVLLPTVTFNMATRLWGGNEQAVIAMIRMLSIADLTLSVNRKEMIRQLDEESAALARCFEQSRRQFEKNGGNVKVFSPGIRPPKMKS